MMRYDLWIALAALVAGCSRQPENTPSEAEAASDAGGSTAATVAEPEAAPAPAADPLLLSDVGAMLADEMWAAQGEPTRAQAERILRAVDERAAALKESTPGLRLYVDARSRASAYLAEPHIGQAARARELAAETLAAAVTAYEAQPTDRRVNALLGDAHVGVGRVEWVAGDLESAAKSYETGLEFLIKADKGRGTGTGSAQTRGKGTGGGGGRNKGKGRNREQSVALKRHTLHVYRELTEVYRDAGQGEPELLTWGRMRLVQGGLCKVQSEQPNYGYQKARLDMAEFVDAFGNAKQRVEGPEAALLDERLAQQIARELYAEVPDLLFFERVVPQGIEVAGLLAELVRIDELRELTTQSIEDLKILANLGVSEAERRALEAQVCLQMARGLTASGTDAHRMEAANWFGRVVELLDGLRVDGVMPEHLAATEEAAIVGIDNLQQ